MSLRYTILSAALLGFIAATPVAIADTPDISTWQVSTETHPAGTVYTNDKAIVARYPIAALDAASSGGMTKLIKRPPLQRMEMALSIASLGMSEFEMTKLYGMPAAIGTVETSDGSRHFAAAFSGRAGTDRELLSVFTAPQAVFDRMGGLEVLKDNSPKRSINYGGMGTVFKPQPNTSKSTLAPKAPPVPTAKAPTQTQRPKRSTSGADLLAGVRGDMDRLNKKTAARLAIERAEKADMTAKADKLERERIYQASGAKKGFYPPLSNKMEYLAWPREGNWNVQVPNDKRSPRTAMVDVTGRDMVPENALKALIKTTGLRIKGTPKFERMEAYQSFDGRDFRILLTETNMPRDKGVAFIIYGREKGSESASVVALEMPRKTYAAWGGVAGMLRLRGVVPSIDVFPKSERNRISKAPLAQQVAFYEAVLDKFYMTEAISLMMTQARTTAMMTELNYDLLFGDDITSPFIAD